MRGSGLAWTQLPQPTAQIQLSDGPAIPSAVAHAWTQLSSYLRWPPYFTFAKEVFHNLPPPNSATGVFSHESSRRVQHERTCGLSDFVSLLRYLAAWRSARINRSNPQSIWRPRDSTEPTTSKIRTVTAQISSR